MIALTVFNVVCISSLISPVVFLIFDTSSLNYICSRKQFPYLSTEGKKKHGIAPQLITNTYSKNDTTQKHISSTKT